MTPEHERHFADLASKMKTVHNRLRDFGFAIADAVDHLELGELVALRLMCEGSIAALDAAARRHARAFKQAHDEGCTRCGSEIPPAPADSAGSAHQQAQDVLPDDALDRMMAGACEPTRPSEGTP